MKSSKRILLAILILPWLTIPLLGKNALIRYAPSAIFICTFTKAIDVFGENKKWWRFYKGIPPLNSMNFFNLGPYLVMSLWMLKYTFGKFPLYFFTNTILHILFLFPGLKFVARFKIFSLVKLTRLQYLAVNSLRAVLLYLFQMMIELNRYKNTDFMNNSPGYNGKDVCFRQKK